MRTHHLPDTNHTSRRPTRPRLLAGALAATGLALFIPWGSANTAGAASARNLVITSHNVGKLGTVLTTSSGLTLYHLTSDPSGKATCTGACAKVWPPLLVSKGEHIKGPKRLKDFGTIHLAHGKLQASFHGEALYRFSGDKKEGQATGQGVEGTWFAVKASNKVASVTPLPAATSTTSTAPAATTTTSTTAKASTPAATSPPATSPSVTSPPVTSPPPAPTTTATTRPAPTTTTTTAPPGGGYGY
jgi:predicted lipoprotein with Yx(FWY)xxD motif